MRRLLTFLLRPLARAALDALDEVRLERSRQFMLEDSGLEQLPFRFGVTASSRSPHGGD
jgi:hypothetical protein